MQTVTAAASYRFTVRDGVDTLGVGASRDGGLGPAFPAVILSGAM